MKFLKKDKNGGTEPRAGSQDAPAAPGSPKFDPSAIKARIRGLIRKEASADPAAEAGVPSGTPEARKKAGIADQIEALKARLGGRGKAQGGIGQPKPGEKQIAAAKKTIQTPSDISRPEVGVIAFGKKQTAVGLQWLPPDADIPIKQRLADLTEQSLNDATQQSATYSFYTDSRNTGFVGVGGQELGHTAGMKALVTMLSPQITGERWVGAFQISPSGDHWWIGSIRDGKIFNDQVVSSRHQAEEILHNDLQAPDWTTIFAPADWGIHGSRTEELHEVVDLRLGEKLRSSTPIRDNLPRMLMGIAVLAVAIGGFTYITKQKAEQQRELEELRRRAAASVSYDAPDLPWFMATKIETFIRDCSKQIEDALLLVPGWENQPLSCSVSRGEGVVATGWARNGGKTTWLRSLIPADKPAPVFSQDFATASWSDKFTTEVETGEEMSVTPWSPEVMESRIRERFLHYDLPINIRPAAGNVSSATNKVVFNAHEIRLTSEIGFANFGDMLKDIPALVPDALVYSPANGTWDLAFKVNHPPIFPPEMR